MVSPALILFLLAVILEASLARINSLSMLQPRKRARLFFIQNAKVTRKPGGTPGSSGTRGKWNWFYNWVWENPSTENDMTNQSNQPGQKDQQQKHQQQKKPGQQSGQQQRQQGQPNQDDQGRYGGQQGGGQQGSGGENINR